MRPASLIKKGAHDVDVVYAGDWHEHPGFIEANADHVRQALARLPADKRDRESDRCRDPFSHGHTIHFRA